MEVVEAVRKMTGRNASENPTGIETNSLQICWAGNIGVATHQKTQQGLKRRPSCTLCVLLPRRNASENPTGIETNAQTEQSLTHLPCRNASENPTGIENLYTQRSQEPEPGRNASENPTGIETVRYLLRS